MKIILLEDSELNARLVRDLVGAHFPDFEFSYTFDRRSFKRALRAGCDIALIDMVLPEFTGEEAIELSQAMEPKPIIIAFTAYATNEDIDRIRQLGVDDIIRKPISVPEFLSQLSAIASHRRNRED